MQHLEPNRVYTIRVTFPDTAQTVDEAVMGSKADRAIEEAKRRYPNFRRIIVFDADTKDAVAIIRN